MIDAITISLSALNANSERVRVSTNNIANAGTVGALDPTQGAAAYTPQDVVAVADPLGGVQTSVADRDPATVTAYDPNSPYADETGLVAVPNVDLATEVVNTNIASIAYRAALSVIKTSGEMSDSLLKVFDERV